MFGNMSSTEAVAGACRTSLLNHLRRGLRQSGKPSASCRSAARPPARIDTGYGKQANLGKVTDVVPHPSRKRPRFTGRLGRPNLIVRPGPIRPGIRTYCYGVLVADQLAGPRKAAAVRHAGWAWECLPTGSDGLFEGFVALGGRRSGEQPQGVGSSIWIVTTVMLSSPPLALARSISRWGTSSSGLVRRVSRSS
jgi:hypothetical protein